MTLKKVHKVKFNSIDELIRKANQISREENKAKVFGDITVTVVQDNKNDNDKNEPRIQDQLDTIDRIVDRRKKLKKEAISELYEIGERNDEDWENGEN